MTNRIRDASLKLEVTPLSFGHLPKRENGRKRGRPKTEDRSRHGPSTRGDPDIRGKPPDGYNNVILSEVEGSRSNEVAPENERFRIKFGMTAQGTGARSWLQWESRVLAAKKPDDEVGVFIPNRDCFGQKGGEEAPPNLPKGKGQEKKKKNKENVEYRMMNNEYRREKKTEESRS